MRTVNFAAPWLARHGTAVVASTLLLFAVGTLSRVQAQEQIRNMNEVHSRIQERMIREQGGNSPSVRFNDDGAFESISNTETRMRGTGIYYRDRNDRGRNFSFDAVYDIRNANLKRLSYSFSGGGGGGGDQTGYGQTIYCGSEDGRRNQCSVDTRGGVTLVRQKSQVACIQGQTWGYGRNQIWVDRGCRADFEVGAGGIGGGGDPGDGQTIYCGSEDGRRNQCSVDTRGGVALLRQRSEAACIEGQTWGYGRNRIWVDRGCRADFEVGGRDRPDDRYSSGSVTWIGRVDHDVKLVIYGNRVDTYVLSGKDLGLGTYSFTSPMPRNVTVSVRRVKGRNDVTVAEQPSRSNRYSAVIHITDRRGGSDRCEVVISW